MRFSARQTLLHTERLIIRSWEMNDLNDLYTYASVDGVGQMAGWLPHQSIYESKKVLKSFIQSDDVLAIVDQSAQRVIGSIRLHSINFQTFPEFSGNCGREVGYVLSKDYWGRGIMTEALQAVITYYFSLPQAEFLILIYANRNKRSRRVAEKCGFQFYKAVSRPHVAIGETLPATAMILQKEKRDSVES